jgi:NitT/TauT family transport system permease protein
MSGHVAVNDPGTVGAEGSAAQAPGRPAGVLVPRLLGVAAILGAWEFASGRLVNDFWISRPTLIGERLWELAISGDLWWHASATGWQALLGLLLGLVVGVAFGVAFAALPRLAEALDPLVMALYSVPRIAFAPLFIIWFGIGLFSKVMMAFSMAVFVILLNTHQGLKEVDKDLLDLVQSMRASRWYRFSRIQFPAVLPWIFGGIRIAIGLALIGSVLGELLGSNRGLGWYVERAGGTLDTTGVFAGLVALMALAIIANESVRVLERVIGVGRSGA